MGLRLSHQLRQRAGEGPGNLVQPSDLSGALDAWPSRCSVLTRWPSTAASAVRCASVLPAGRRTGGSHPHRGCACQRLLALFASAGLLLNFPLLTVHQDRRSPGRHAAAAGAVCRLGGADRAGGLGARHPRRQDDDRRTEAGMIAPGLAASFAYLLLLFAVAHWADRARAGPLGDRQRLGLPRSRWACTARPGPTSAASAARPARALVPADLPRPDAGMLLAWFGAAQDDPHRARLPASPRSPTSSPAATARARAGGAGDADRAGRHPALCGVAG